jgi:excisionase family DNA binding protein
MAREGYMTVKEIAENLNVSADKIRTIIARLDIQPRRFPGDLRRLYYSPAEIERIKNELNLAK